MRGVMPDAANNLDTTFGGGGLGGPRRGTRAGCHACLGDSRRTRAARCRRVGERPSVLELERLARPRVDRRARCGPCAVYRWDRPAQLGCDALPSVATKRVGCRGELPNFQHRRPGGANLVPRRTPRDRRSETDQPCDQSRWSPCSRRGGVEPLLLRRPVPR